MLSDQTQPPDPEELEISLFGSGYGEAVALHMGNGQWILIDSCLEQDTDSPASLEYLKNLGIDVSEAVKLIVATHWHDDHIRGISTIYRECKSAKFAVTGAFKSEELLRLIKLYSRSTLPGDSGLDEFIEIFRIHDERKGKSTLINSPKLAMANTVLYSDQISLSSIITQRKVSSLSPSDACILRANLDRLLPKAGEYKKRITSPTPNQVSVVLWIEIGSQKFLLGSDLEITRDPSTGWAFILDSSTVISGMASVFKVPHHGAESAHEPRVWSELVHPSPIAILSPFSLGNTSLPTTGDIQRLNGLTPDAYITSNPSRTRRHRWSNRVVTELVGGATRHIYDVIHGWGHIRIRRSIIDETASYESALFGDAISLKTTA